MTTSPAVNTVGWFQIETPDATTAAEFYGGLFGWSSVPDPSSGAGYNLITYPGADAPSGGIADTGGASPSQAIFLVHVADVAATLSAAEELGGKVVVPPITTPAGLTFAKIADPGGSLFGVYSPPAR